MMRYAIFSLTSIAVSAAFLTAQTPPSTDEEIARARKELGQVQLDCGRVAQESDKDRKDFEAYRARTAQRYAEEKQQLDALKTETDAQTVANNALAAKLGALQQARREIELSQDEFRKRLVALCGTVQPFVKKLPPLAIASQQSSLSLLANDLSTKSVDIVEGCTRLVQILGRLDDAGAAIQIAQESSPFADIPGLVYRLRIGAVFEAVVDLKGERCALFDGWNADGAPRWRVPREGGVAGALLMAVNIREGKALPAFVNLPLAPAPAQGGVR
jgi:hypothetical protein